MLIFLTSETAKEKEVGGEQLLVSQLTRMATGRSEGF